MDERKSRSEILADTCQNWTEVQNAIGWLELGGYSYPSAKDGVYYYIKTGFLESVGRGKSRRVRLAQSVPPEDLDPAEQFTTLAFELRRQAVALDAQAAAILRIVSELKGEE